MNSFSSGDRRIGTYIDEQGFIPDVRIVDSQGNEAGSVGGSKDSLNSTATPLEAGATFTGEWVQNNDPQLAYNVITDQPGTVYVEFSIDGTTALQTLSKPYQVFANDPQFDALVKMPGRFHRMRYVNGATTQGKFGLVAATGDGLYPFSVSDRDAPRFAASNGQAITAQAFRIVVDLSDRANYKHHFTGRIDLYSAFFSITKAANTVGQVQAGIITRISATDADIVFIQGVSFNSTSDRSFVRDRVFRSPILCGQSGGIMTAVSSGFKLTTTLVNTTTPLPTQYGTATPAVGDMVARYDYTSGGAYDAAVSVQYATSNSST